MSLQIIRAGIFDSIQDCGRKGFQHLGINPAGAMDRFSAALANALLGKDLCAPVMELHFPATKFRFDKAAIISITGGDFSPHLNGEPVPMMHPIAIHSNSILEFMHLEKGFRSYLSFLPELDLQPWLGSYSTNIKAHAGGWKGRNLQKDDSIGFQNEINIDPLLKGRLFSALPLMVAEMEMEDKTLHCIIGSEWNRLSEAAKETFSEGWFEITTDADRMGYRLKGREMLLENKNQVVSSAATFGTIQLLPNGQLIILMADHQTTGGYPKIANIISADLPLLAQKPPGTSIRFRMCELAEAENKYKNQMGYLNQVQEAAGTRLKELMAIE